MPALADRVKETTTTTGTGTLTLGGAATGFQTFSGAFGNGVSVYYVISGGSEWEVGIGTTGAGTLSRDTVLKSSNANALVSLSAGTKDVFCSYAADRAVTTSDTATLTNKTISGASNTLSNIGNSSLTNSSVTVNGTSIALGASGTVTAAAGTLTGTTLNATVTGSSLTGVGTLTSGAIGTGFTAIPDSALATISTAGKVSNSATTATSANTASAIVARDASGNFTAGTITATLSGAAPAGSLSGSTLASGVTASSLTSVGTLTGLTTSGTTSLATTGGALSVRGVSYVWPSAQGGASTTLTNDGAGNLSWAAGGGAAAAGTLTGTTLASNVVNSSLTSVGTLSALTVGGTLTMQQVLEKVTVNAATSLTGTVNYDCLTQAVTLYQSAPAANWTLNLRGNSGTSLASTLAVGQSMTVTLMVQLGASMTYYSSATTIDGNAVTPKWQGTYAPNQGIASALNVYTYTIIKTAATPTYTVLAALNAY